MNEERIFIALRQMAWERAKGELLSILQIFWDDQENFDDLDKRFNEFIESIEGETCIG